MNLLQFLRRNPLPGDHIEVVGTPSDRALLGQTGTFVRYTFAVVQINGEEREISVNNIKLLEQSGS
jgi:RNase P/RNase MRP subunit p29